MKRIYLNIFACMTAAVALSSCDSVSEPDRFIPAEIVPQRSILIEEFTGQLCTNCPDGHVAIKDILASLGDSVVPVSIHASALALDVPLGYKTPTGEEYYKADGSPALPTAVINQMTAPLQVENWGSALNHIIMESTPFTVKASTEFKGNDYNIDVAFSSGEDFTGKLQVWIVENDLVGLQLDHGTYVTDYVHNHVFRAAVTPSIWGDDVQLEAHTPQYKSYTYSIPATWNKDNIYVVAFLYNSNGVAQVTTTMSGH